MKKMTMNSILNKYIRVKHVRKIDAFGVEFVFKMRDYYTEEDLYIQTSSKAVIDRLLSGEGLDSCIIKQRKSKNDRMYYYLESEAEDNGTEYFSVNTWGEVYEC